MVSLSNVTVSMALCSCSYSVPPGFSETPRDFIPMNLFSTKSTLPIQSLPASLINFANSFTAESFFQLTEHGSPFLKLIVTKDALFGAFSGETDL